ncbi:MAG: Asp-tRNA(Asn)/Glu-tRNA(Gln) amidotransferase subunit GatB [Nitrospirae bacterium]|nr:Asp-tRNA(Asn)/Glu-tRNA(Gln) amidotransferase subunit GatB [Nitrospirota bacterium]
MAYEVVIGLEVHAQLLTASKMFCGCGTAFGAAPNTQTCPVCLGMPGVLPVINHKAVEFAVRTGLALHCTIAPLNRFARKHYFYPDLPKGYQISQYELPICEHGWVEIGQSGTSKRVRIRRAHLEEDAGKNLHAGIAGASHVDLNRAGTPLLEIVTEPDMGSPDEAVAYLKALRDILVYLEVCDGNMEEGSLRCEPNLSLRPVGSKELGTKVELKNINSFKFVKAAMEYEIKRQAKVLNEGGKVAQETRLWDTEKGETAVMRSKEEAHDYRYFTDPDLVPLRITTEMVEEARKSLPELSAAKHKRFMEEYGLPEYDAGVLTAEKALAEFFESTVKVQAESISLSWKELGKETSNWVTVELLGLLHKGKPAADGVIQALTIDKSPVSPQGLADLLVMKRKGDVSGPIAKSVLEEMFTTGKGAVEIVKAKGLTQVSDEGALEKIIDEVMAKNQQQVSQYRSGKEAVFGFFVGQVMKASGGKANPAKVNELLKRKLSA